MLTQEKRQIIKEIGYKSYKRLYFLAKFFEKDGVNFEKMIKLPKEKISILLGK